MADYKDIAGRIRTAAFDGVAVEAQEILDINKNKKQSEVNAETDATLAEHTSTINGLNSQNYVTVTATDQTTAVTDVLPATGEVATVYRVGNWDGSQYDETCYSEYSWNGSAYVHLSTKTQIGEVFDISAYHATGGTLATYADLSAALDSNNGGGVPQSLRKGGMSVKFVHTNDNKYVQYRFLRSTFTTAQFINISNWKNEYDFINELAGAFFLAGNGTSPTTAYIKYLERGKKYRISIKNASSLSFPESMASNATVFRIFYWDAEDHDINLAYASKANGVRDYYDFTVPNDVPIASSIIIQFWLVEGISVFGSVIENIAEYLAPYIEEINGQVGNITIVGKGATMAQKKLYIEEGQKYVLALPQTWELPSSGSGLLTITRTLTDDTEESLLNITSFTQIRKTYVLSGDSTIKYYTIKVRVKNGERLPIMIRHFDVLPKVLTKDFDGNLQGFVGEIFPFNGIGDYSTSSHAIRTDKIRYINCLIPCKKGDVVYADNYVEVWKVNSEMVNINQSAITGLNLIEWDSNSDGYVLVITTEESSTKAIKLSPETSDEVCDMSPLADELFDHPNQAINRANGNYFNSSTGYYATRKISLLGYKKLRMLVPIVPSTSDVSMAFYSEDGTFILSKRFVGEEMTQEIKDIDVPYGAFYFATCIKGEQIPNMVMQFIQSESEALEEKVTNIPMMLGYTTDGFTIKGTSTERWDRSYSKLIKVNGTILEIPSGNNARCACFDKDFNFIEYTSDLSHISEAAYIRCIRDEINADIVADFIIKHTGSIEFVNEPYLANNTFAPRWFTVDVAFPLDNPTTAWTDREKLYTNAWISLPWNYKQSGKKSKLIVYGTGTSGAKWDSVSDGADEKVNFFNAMGYACIVVNANTNKYSAYKRNNAATPLGVACFVAAVKYVVDNYNIDNEIYIYGKSDGGMTTMNLINTSNLNIKAAAIHCPNLDVFNEFRCMGLYENSQQGQLTQFNISSYLDGGWPSAAIAELKTKQDNFDGYNPMTFKCTINKKEYDDYVLDHTYPMSQSSYPNSGMKDYSDTYLMGQDMQNIVKDAKLFLNIPVKIWYADDDPQVPYGTIVNFAKMASNAGCICKLRKFADGTGGHYCADAWSQSTAAGANLAPRVDVQTRYGGTMNMPLGIVEALQWLEMW